MLLQYKHLQIISTKDPRLNNTHSVNNRDRIPYTTQSGEVCQFGQTTITLILDGNVLRLVFGNQKMIVLLKIVTKI